MLNGIILFAVINLINVIISTTKSLFTVKGGKISASVVNAVCFGFYTYVLVITANGEMSIHLKALIVTLANLVGVFIVKFIEEKMSKDKLWVFTATVKETSTTIDEIVNALKEMKIKLVYNEIVPNSLYSLQIFSNTQKESVVITSILANYNIKYYATESKIN